MYTNLFLKQVLSTKQKVYETSNNPSLQSKSSQHRIFFNKDCAKNLQKFNNIIRKKTFQQSF